VTGQVNEEGFGRSGTKTGQWVFAGTYGRTTKQVKGWWGKHSLILARDGLFVNNNANCGGDILVTFCPGIRKFG
jgi:hypothetical protein